MRIMTIGIVNNKKTTTTISICRIQIKRNGSEKSQLSFVENFPLSGLATEVLKAAVAPIERVKLLVQNQSETMKQGTLS